SAGLYHGCAVSAQGQAYCWGGNYSGELGTGEDGYSTRTAVEATAANAEGTIVQISAGGSHTCALLGSGTNRVRCWGQQSNGRLGNGSTEGAVVPIPQTVVLANVGSVAAGYNGTCAVL